ncbi:MAG TPA: trypsin-like peptidase domain-containing protein [Myxococcaceae bacterium]|nr:trypsin-like peptidase domain-containing protein [Myxococcaceae bacterium]
MKKAAALFTLYTALGSAPDAAAQASGGPLGLEEQNVIRIVKQVSPAVVSIGANEGSGSGVIIRADGVILTNVHVVGQRPVVAVRLASGQRVEGRVLGRDPANDIAVVKIAGSDLPYAQLGDSDRLEVGQAAIAIGNPLGLERTLTVGVVSAKNRRILGDSAEGFIQTDAAINPGNSGGPLLDSRGRVIGINTLILRNAANLGFAVPISLASNAAEQILNTGRVQRVRMGVAYNDVDPEMAAAFKLPVQQGVVIAGVSTGSPAARAGIREQDIITKVDDATIASGGDLRRALRNRKPGDKVQVTVRRGGQTVTVTAVLTAPPA